MTYSTCSRLSCDGRSSSGQLHRTCSGSHLKNSATELIATTDSSKTKEYICSTNRGSNGGSLGFRSFQNSGLANAPILSECENKWCQHQYRKHRVLFEPVGECRLLLRLRRTTEGASPPTVTMPVRLPGVSLQRLGTWSLGGTCAGQRLQNRGVEAPMVRYTETADVHVVLQSKFRGKHAAANTHTEKLQPQVVSSGEV